MFQHQPTPQQQAAAAQQMMQQQQQLQQQQRREHTHQFVSAEAQAREKLSHYVYEYLFHIGASKTAEMFKNEVLVHHNNGNPNMHIDLSPSPGFLLNWFSVFWDLYSAHPDKKEKAEPSNEAKVYHKMMFPGCSGFPPEGLVNGAMPPYGPVPPGFPPNPNMGPMPPPPQNMPDGMFPSGSFYNGPRPCPPQPGPSQSNQASPIPGGPSNRYMPQQGTRSGAPTPSSVIAGPSNNFPPNQYEQMRLMAMAQQQQQRQAAQQQGRVPLNLPIAGPHSRVIRPPPPFGNQFMDSPTNTPPFPMPMPHNAGGSGGGNGPGNNAMCTGASLMSPTNGPVQQMAPSMSNPVNAGQMPGPEQGGPGSHDPTRFVMMGGMQQQFMNHHEQSGSNGTSGGGGSGVTGPASVSGQATGMNGGANCEANNIAGPGGMGSSNGNGPGQPGSQLHSLLNGTNDMAMEMKQSPASVHFGGGQQAGSVGGGAGGGMNGGTPMTTVGGPMTAGPSSVHSQSGSTTGNQPQQQQGSVGGGGQQQQQQTPISEAMDLGGHMGNQQSDEISKIKASLMEDYPQASQFQQQ